MARLVGCAFMPHPPIMIPEVGQGETSKIKKTVSAAITAAQFIKEQKPQTIIIITPHGPVFRDAVSITMHPRLKGSLAAFGAPEVVLGFETDGLLMRQILKQTKRLGVPLIELTNEVAVSYRVSLELDHGAVVPLYYIDKAGFRGQLVHLSVGMLPYEEMYTFGKAVQAAIKMSGKRVAVVASGDLSHRLTQDAPAGYSPQGQVFDNKVLQALTGLDVKAMLSMDNNLIEAAGECGFRPLLFLMGVIGGLEAKAELLSYEGPFGVGYAVAVVNIAEDTDGGEDNG